MKKTGVIMLTALLSVLFCIQAAAKAVFPTIDIPEIKAAALTAAEDDFIITAGYDEAVLSFYEESRKGLLDIAIAGGYSFEELLESEQAYLCYETRVFCEISCGSDNFFVLKNEAENGAFTLSAKEDILPLLAENSVDVAALTDGFTLKLRLFAASSNYTGSEAETLFVKSSPGAAAELSFPAFSYIHYSGITGAENPNAEFFTGPITEDIALGFPKKTGCTFAGWREDGGAYIGKIPAGTRFMRLCAEWTPKSWKINYVLATNISFNFGRADNTANPTKYSYGTAAALYDIKSPVGGYSFCGWYDNENFEGEKISAVSEGAMGDIILYARWRSFEDIAAEELEKNEAAAAKKGYADIDSDGKVTAADARLLLRAAVGLEKLSAEQERRADIYGTGLISAGSARLVLRIAVGLESLSEVLKENGVEF